MYFFLLFPSFERNNVGLWIEFFYAPLTFQLQTVPSVTEFDLCLISGLFCLLAGQSCLEDWM